MLAQYIDSLRQSGKVSFTASEACEALGISKAALRMAVSRLKKNRAIVSPYKDLYVPVPPEYRSIGCLPAEQLLPLLMQYLDEPYYMCLLSAAAMHGAAHQRPQIAQVMVGKQYRAIRCGSVVLHFIFKKKLALVPQQSVVVPTGYLQVSTPEVTMMDLLLYPKQSGGFNHIATVVTELIDVVAPEQLAKLVNASNEIAWVQKLGYILEQLDPLDTVKKDQCLAILREYIQQKNPPFLRLISGAVKGCIWNKDWKLIVNTKIESDI